MAETSWKAMDSGVMDWLDNKRAKTLRVSNDRESFQLKKIRRSLETMKSMNDNLMKQEERKVKRWLAKQAELSPSSSLSYKNLYKKHSKDFTPFSGTDLSMQTVSAGTSYGPRGSFYNPHPTASVSKKDISARQLYVDNNSFSMQEAISMFPSLQKLSVTGEKFSFSKLHLHETASGSPAFERRLKGMLERAWEEEKFKQTVTLPQIRPEEFLSCRYLRLSQSNINTLLQLCKESGVHIDIHPHMKESEIDINTVLSSNLSRAV
ncbi:unnamed protein product [Natator depressus]